MPNLGGAREIFLHYDFGNLPGFFLRIPEKKFRTQKKHDFKEKKLLACSFAGAHANVITSEVPVRGEATYMPVSLRGF